MKNKSFERLMSEFSKKKSETGRISLSSEEFQHYDLFSVYISDPENEKEYLFESYRDGVVYALAWDEKVSRFTIPKQFPVLVCLTLNFSGTHFYKGHRIDFKSLEELLRYKT